MTRAKKNSSTSAHCRLSSHLLLQLYRRNPALELPINMRKQQNHTGFPARPPASSLAFLKTYGKPAHRRMTSPSKGCCCCCCTGHHPRGEFAECAQRDASSALSLSLPLTGRLFSARARASKWTAHGGILFSAPRREEFAFVFVLRERARLLFNGTLGALVEGERASGMCECVCM